MKTIFIRFLIVQVLQLVAAFICAPHSCEWGNTVFFITGLACLPVAFILPLFSKKMATVKRIGLALLLVLVSAFIWCALFILCDFKIMCRMF